MRLSSWQVLVWLPQAVFSLSVAASSCGDAGEVIGASGRIGSFLLRAGAGTLAATPRGLAPGSLSPPGTPILVATPVNSLPDVLLSCPSNRRRDLVLLSNGMVIELAANILEYFERCLVFMKFLE